MRYRPGLILACVLAAWPALVSGAGAGPEGPWETFDERTGLRRALVRVSLRDGQLVGVIERVFVRPGEQAEPLCTRCRGSLHNRPVLGLEILRGHRRDGDRFTGGTILDPENGKQYRSAVWLEAPERLRVRGYWGPFYRTQVWRRPRDGDRSQPAASEDGAGSRP